MKDDPIIRRMEQTGYGGQRKQPVCPVCGSECEQVYKDVYLEIMGCDECLTEYDAWDEEECFPRYEE